MKDIFLVYKTDDWHSHASKDLIGVGTTLLRAINLCKQQAKMEDKRLDSDQLSNLNNMRQTQGYEGKGEFHIDPVTPNSLV